MTDHLTPQMLALYLGCECAYYNEGFSYPYKSGRLTVIADKGDWGICYEYWQGKKIVWSCDNPRFLKPILRPTHTLNLTDALKYLNARYSEWQVEVLEVEHETPKRTRGFWYRYNSGKRWSKKYWLFHWALCVDAETTVHLLKERFDILSLIEKGLAIDATKIKGK